MQRKDIQPIYSQAYRKKRRRSWVIISAFLLSILILISFIMIGSRNRNFDKYQVKGVMISQQDGYLDFNELKNGEINFVYLRASQGSSYTDDNFTSNYERSQGSQLAVGIYHVFSFSSSVDSQFNNFIKETEFNTGILPISIYVDYYGDYDEDNVDWKEYAKRINQLAEKINRYYNQSVVIQMPQEIKGKLAKYLDSNFKIWIIDNKFKKQNSEVEFISSENKYKISMRNSSAYLYRIVYNGSKRQWNTNINSLGS